MKIAVCGAGIAGPTLAHWLLRAGHEVTLIEEADRLRTGGYVIDFWGLGYDVAQRMGILPRIVSEGYRVGEVKLVDRRGHRVGGFSAEIFRRALGDRFTSLPRGNLASAIYDSLGGRAETLFGDSVQAVEEDDSGVRAQLVRGGERRFDLLVGADGQHSAVRASLFGPESRYERPLGYYVAACAVDGYRPREELTYITHATPAREMARFALRDDRTMLLFVFHADCLEGPEPQDISSRRAALRQVFQGQDWEAAQMLAAMEDASDIYFDRMSQIVMPAWSAGRTALVGDAAACVSLLAGEGCGLGMVEAYVLAGEIVAAQGDHRTAFQRYEQRLRPFIEAKQASARRFASFFAPTTKRGIWLRNQASRLFGLPFVGDAMVKREFRDDFELPDYSF